MSIAFIGGFFFRAGGFLTLARFDSIAFDCQKSIERTSLIEALGLQTPDSRLSTPDFFKEIYA